jgi:hypothetical protein
MRKNMQWLPVLVTLLVIVPLVAAACGKDKRDNKGGAVELTETFASSTGFTVKYPDGWAARDGGAGPEIVNSEAAFAQLDAEDRGEIAEGQFVLVIFDPTQFRELPGLADLDAKAVVTMIAGSMSSEGGDEGMTAGEVKDAKVGDRDAGRTEVSDPSVKGQGFILGYKLDDTTVILVVALAREGELGNYEATVTAMLNALTYTAPAG